MFYFVAAVLKRSNTQIRQQRVGVRVCHRLLTVREMSRHPVGNAVPGVPRLRANAECHRGHSLQDRRTHYNVRQQPSHSPPGGFRAARLGGEWPAAGSTYQESNCKVAGRNVRVPPCPQGPVSQRSRLVSERVYRTEFMTPVAFQTK